MNFSAPFIARPVATILLSIGLFLAGAVAYRFLPVAALPSIDVPYIVVIAARPGADPETMANSVAAPLERRLGEIAGVTEITSTSSIGNTSVVLQFDISRDINGAAHDVQAAINAATTDLPADLPVRPYYRKFNPADAPIMTIALSSTTATTAQIYDAADSVLAQRLAQVEGVAQVTVNGAEKPAVRIALDPVRLAATGLSGQDVYNAVRAANTIGPLGGFQGEHRSEGIALNSQIAQAAEYRPLIVKSADGAILRLSDVATVTNGVANTRLAAWNGQQPAILLNITKEAGANVIETVDRPELAEALKHEMDKQKRDLPCFIQVNTGNEEQKGGVAPKNLPALYTLCKGLKLNITGLMCIPPVNDIPDLHFALLHKLAGELGLKHLSMGMSADFDVAIRYGATHVRIGSALFGDRKHPGLDPAA